MVFCHPVANCFHRRSPVEGDDNNEAASTAVPTLTLPGGTAGGSGADIQFNANVKKGQHKNGEPEGVTTAAAEKDSKPLTHVNQGAEASPEHAYISTFIIGLSFQKGSRFIDIEPPIQVSNLFTLSVSTR